MPSLILAASGLSRRALLAGLIGAAACLAAMRPVHAAAPAGAFDAAFQQFQRAAGGDTASIEPAAEQFARLVADAPGDPVLLAYGGSATAMRATTTWLPWRKMGFADDGLAQIDKGLALLAPAHDAPLYRGVAASLETRFVAASTFLRLPGMFHRHARGERLLDKVLKSPLLAAAPVGFRAAVWLRAAEAATGGAHPEQARGWLQKVADSGAPQAALAQARLKGAAR
jgi:hypothetical protein